VSVRAARRFVHDVLAEAGADSFTATLLTSELASNAVEHATTDFDVVVTIDDATVRVEIHDGAAISETFRELVRSPPSKVAGSSPRGRGLQLVATLAVRFGFLDKGAEGKAIWFELKRQPETSARS
jgi:anti-sigma regulatory factor (Ser/Thr protein kinase)